MAFDPKEFRMTYDLHTHTIYSPGRRSPHGKGTVEENVLAAVNAGLEAIAISDHGPGHTTYGLKWDSLDKLKQDIAESQEKHPEIKIFLSLEANIVDSTKNHLDITPEEAKQFDFILAGYHYATRGSRMVRNWFDGIGISSSRRERQGLIYKNTLMTVKAIQQNDIKVLTHPGDKYPVDMGLIAQACEENGVLMELNTHHKHLTAEELEIAKLYDVKFIISSDAHTPDRVGDFQDGLLRAYEAGLDLDRIVNITHI